MSGHRLTDDCFHEGLRDASNQYSINLHHICQHCGHQSNSVSNLRKHSLRHEKSHKCDVPQCSRGDRGFGTINDLERHKKSKHGIKPKHGTAKSYRCASKKCEWAPKIWPRLDNFKQHVKRVHRNEDAERLIAMSEYAEGPPTPPGHLKELKCFKGIPASTRTGPFKGAKMNVSCGRKFESQLTAQIKAERIDSDETFSRLQIEHTEFARKWKCQSQKLNVKQEPKWYSMDKTIASVPTKPMSSPKTFVELNGRHFCTNDSPNNCLTRLPPITMPYSRRNLDPVSPPYDHHESPSKERFLASTKRTSSISDSKERARESGHVFDRVSEDQNQSSSLPLRRSFITKQEISHCHRWPVISAETPNRSDVSGQGKRESKYCIRSHLELSNGSKLPSSSEDKICTNDNALEHLPPQGLTLSNEYNLVDFSTRVRLGLPSSLNTSCKTSPGLQKHTHQTFIQYGCTFPDCYRVFKSRKTWRRHESGQHFQVESWRCHLPRSSPKYRKCARVFFRVDAFRNHIYEHHKLREFPSLGTEYWRGRVGRNGQGSFWCGFCKEVLQLRERAIAAWEERFRHIEGHFMAGDDINSWLCIFTNETKRDILLRRARNKNLHYSISERAAAELTLHHSSTDENHLLKCEKENIHNTI